MTFACSFCKMFFPLAILLTATVFPAYGKSQNSGDDLRKGKAAYEIKNYKTAVKSFSLAAQAGSAEAQFMLGICYLDGKGVEQDFEKGLECMKKAAEKGHVKAKAAMASFKISDGRFVATVKLPGGAEMTMVRIPAGSFVMSENGTVINKDVPHKVTLKKDFFIGQTEVTQAQWKAVMGNNPSKNKGDDLPVENVSWNDAMKFRSKLNEMGKAPDGWTFTLPTETQWEYAARGGSKSKGYQFSGSNDVDEVAWYIVNSGIARLDPDASLDTMDRNHCGIHPVAQKKANELGLYDMSGNVQEWCLDIWKVDSSKQVAEFKEDNDLGGSRRVFRGGSWFNPDLYCQFVVRDSENATNKRSYRGFRLALVPVQ